MDIALPGIDSAAPAAASPAPSAVENPAATSASADTPVTPGTTDQPIDNARDPETQAQAPEPDRERTGETESERSDGERRRRPDRGLQRRFEEITRKNDELSGQVRTLMDLVTRGQQPQQRQAAAPDDPEPQESQFSDWREYQRSLAKWEGRNETRRILAERDAQFQRQHAERTQQEQVQQAQQAIGSMQSHLAQKMVEAAAKFPDYHDVIESSNFDFPVALQASIAASEVPGEVAYYLAQNESVARQLAKLDPIRMSQYVARIAFAMKGSSTTRSNTPAPGKPGASRGTSALAYPENATPEQHLAWVERQGKR